MAQLIFTIYEAGAWVDRTAAVSTYSYTDSISERNTLSVTFADGSWSPVQGQRIKLHHETRGYLFNGTIYTLKRTQLGAEIQTECSCVAREAVLSQRTTGARTYKNQKLGDVVRDLIENCAGGEGFDVSGVLAEGPAIAELSFDWPSISDALDSACTAASGTEHTYYWNITADDVVQCYDESAYPAPLTIKATNILRGSTPAVSESGEKLANRVAVRLGSLISDSRTETLTGYGGTTSHSVTLPIAAAPSITNGTTGASCTVGVDGVDTAKDWYWSLNSSTLTSAVALADGDTVIVTYQGYESKVYGWAEDSAAIDARAALEGGTGYHETVIDTDDAVTYSQAAARAQAYLDAYKEVAITFEGTTTDTGIAAGQAVSVTIPALQIDRTMLVDTVTMVPSGAAQAWQIKCIAGALLGDWKRMLREMTGKSVTTAGVSGSGATSGTTITRNGVQIVY